MVIQTRVVWGVLLLLGGCSGGGTGEQAAAGCAAMAAGLERDDCYQQELLRQPGSAVAVVRETAALIEDEMIRQAALSRWVGEHANEVSKPDGEALCGMLGGRDQSYCLKRFYAAHLQR